MRLCQPWRKRERVNEESESKKGGRKKEED